MAAEGVLITPQEAVLQDGNPRQSCLHPLEQVRQQWRQIKGAKNGMEGWEVWNLGVMGVRKLWEQVE